MLEATTTLTETANQLSDSQSQLSSLEAEAEGLKTLLAAEQAEKESLERTTADLQLQLKKEEESKSTIQTMLAESEDHKKSIEHMVTNLERDNRDYLERLAEVTEDYETQLTTVKEEVSFSHSENQRLRHDYEVLKSQAEMSNTLVEQYQQSSTEKEQELVTQLMSKAEELAVNQQVIAQKNLELQELHSLFSEAEKTISSLQDSLNSTKNDLEHHIALKGKLDAELSATSSELQQKLGSLEVERLSLNDSLAQKTSECSSLTEKLGVLNEQFILLQEERHKLEEKSGLQSQVDQQEILQQQIANLQAQNEKLSELSHENQENYLALQTRCTELESETTNLTSQLQAAQEKERLLVADLDRVVKDKEALDEEFKELSSKYTTLINNEAKSLEENEAKILTLLEEAESLKLLLSEKDILLTERESMLSDVNLRLDTLQSDKERLVKEVIIHILVKY